MFFVLVAVASLLVAIVRRGPLLEIAGRRYAGLWALGLAAGLRLVVNPVAAPPGLAALLQAPALPGILPVGGLVYLASLGCALAFLLLNWTVPGFKLVLLGLALNGVVIAANGGQMPADPGYMARAGFLESALADRAAGLWLPFGPADASTRLPFLGDVIFLPLPLREPVILSAGDLAIAAGIFGFFNPLRRRLPLARRQGIIGGAT